MSEKINTRWRLKVKLEVWIATFVLGITFFIAGIIYLGIRGAKEKYFFKAGIFE